MSELTEAQLELVETTGSRYVEACPGAGKTRAIVARYLRRAAAEPRKGIALLSFTNAAVDEVRSRCGLHPQLVRNPHYVGTFDSFVNSFMIGPELGRMLGKYPHFIESWDTQDCTNIRIARALAYQIFKLEWFDIAISQKSAVLNPEKVSSRYERQLLELYALDKQTVDKRAWENWHNRVFDRGYVSCSASRALLMHLIGRERYAARISRLLRARFAEVIVDEAQDCGEEELAVLSLLKESGVHIVMVCDPDQAIFEFRRALPEKVRDFGQQLPQGTRLSANFRSAPSVCRITGSLRFGGQADLAEGPLEDSQQPVILLPYSDPKELAGAIGGLALQLGIPVREVMVLSHKSVDAQRAAGAPLPTTTGNKVIRIAKAALVLRNPHSTAKLRKVAVEQVKRVLLDLIDGVELGRESTDALCERLQIPTRWFNATVYRLCVGTAPLNTDQISYSKGVRNAVSQIVWPSGIALRDLSKGLRAPAESEWADLAPLDAGAVALPWATIHSSKGLEFEVVALIIPQRLIQHISGSTVLDHWERNIDSEARRVLYVGVSRAKQALILAVHVSHMVRVERLLLRDDVPFSVHRLSPDAQGILVA